MTPEFYQEPDYGPNMPNPRPLWAVICLILAGILAGCLFLANGAHGAEVDYREYHGNVYGSDGSKAHQFGGDTYITDKAGHETKCHEFAGKTTCRDN